MSINIALRYLVHNGFLLWWITECMETPEQCSSVTTAAKQGPWALNQRVERLTPVPWFFCTPVYTTLAGYIVKKKQQPHSLCPAVGLMLFCFPFLIQSSVCISVLHFQSVSTGAGCLMRRQGASDRSIGRSDSLLCCPPHWQGGSSGSIVGGWQPSAPWHLSACCSPSATYRC